MTVEGVDFSSSRPGGAALAAAGKVFVVRYVPTGVGPKDLSPAEIADYHGHGISICLVFETTAGRALAGKVAGASDAAIAKTRAAALGFPATTPIYFAVDFDATDAQLGAVDAYLTGAASSLGIGRVGVYGGLRTIRHCQATKTASWFWQTYAWSSGVVAPSIHLLQYQNDAHIGAASVDLCRAYPVSYGQWAPAGVQGGPNVGGDMVPALPDNITPMTATFPVGETLYAEDAITPISKVPSPRINVPSPDGVGPLRSLYVSWTVGHWRKCYAAPTPGSLKPVAAGGLSQADVDRAAAAARADEKAKAIAAVQAI